MTKRPTLCLITNHPDPENLHRRIALALSILQHRAWAAEDQPHVSEAIAALDDHSIDDIARTREAST